MHECWALRHHLIIYPQEIPIPYYESHCLNSLRRSFQILKWFQIIWLLYRKISQNHFNRHLNIFMTSWWRHLPDRYFDSFSLLSGSKIDPTLYYWVFNFFKGIKPQSIFLGPRIDNVHLRGCLRRCIYGIKGSHEFTFVADIFLTIIFTAFIYLALAAFRFNPESKKGLG